MLCSQFRSNNAEPGNVAAWSCKVNHQSGGDRITHESHHNRNCSSCGFESLGGGSPAGNDDINVAACKISGKPGQCIDFVVSPLPFNRNRPSLHIPMFC